MLAFLLPILALTAGVLWSSPAHAYLDPTTGSILLQGLLAGLAGFAVVMRLYWGRVKTFILRLIGKA